MYESYWNKKKRMQSCQEEQIIINSKFKPGEIVLYKGHQLRLSYSEVQEGKLVYLAHSRKRSYWIPETELLDQI